MEGGKGKNSCILHLAFLLQETYTARPYTVNSKYTDSYAAAVKVYMTGTVKEGFLMRPRLKEVFFYRLHLMLYTVK